MKYFFWLIMLVVCTESKLIHRPTMDPDLSDIVVKENQSLEIKCVSTRKMKFVHQLINSEDLELPTNYIIESQINGIYTIKLQINKTVYGHSGWYGCYHDEQGDNDDNARWTYVHVENTHNHDDAVDASYFRVTSDSPYMQFSEDSILYRSCNSEGRITFSFYKSPWKFCILSTEDNSNQDSRIKLQKFKNKDFDIFECKHFEYNDILKSARISHEKQVRAYYADFLKNQTVRGDIGWYGCSSIWNNIKFYQWRYMAIDNKRNFFVDINDFQDILVDVNKSLTLPCRPTSPEYQVTLYANKKEITNDNNVTFNYSRGFTLKNVQLKDSGYYECRISSNGITEESGFHVTVTNSYSYKPTMIPDLSYIELMEYESLNLTCTSIQKSEMFFIPWLFVNNVRDPRLIESTVATKVDEVYTINLKKIVKLKDSGWYGCGNYKNTKINIRWVYVYVKAKPWIERLTVYYDQEGIMEVGGTVETFPNTNMEWKFDQSFLDSNTRITQKFSGRSEYFGVNALIEFPFSSISYMDHYTLTVSNEFGSDSAIIPINLSGENTQYGITSSNKKVIVGDKLELTCTVPLGRMSASLDWLDIHNSSMTKQYNLRIKNRLIEYIDFQQSILTINPVDASDEKQYFCKTDKLNFLHRVRVYQLKKPSFMYMGINLKKTISKYRIGEKVLLECYSDAIPEPIITWSKNNVQINTANPNMPDNNCNYTFYHDAQQLHIGNFHESCIGNYSCKVENYLGHDETYQQLVLDDPTI